jgi:hypothetical protein
VSKAIILESVITSSVGIISKSKVLEISGTTWKERVTVSDLKRVKKL